MEYTFSSVITVKIGSPIKTKSMCLQRLVQLYVVGILGGEGLCNSVTVAEVSTLHHLGTPVTLFVVKGLYINEIVS